METYYQKNKERLLAKSKVYNSKNKEKIKIYNKEYYKSNEQEIKLYDKEYRENNKEKINAYSKEYYNTHKEQISIQEAEHYKNNKERIKNREKEWCKNNTDIKNTQTAKRRATKLNATPKWLTKDHFKEIQDFYTKSKELEKETGIKYHVDHIVPLQGETVSGLHVPWNLQIITAEENLSKSNKFKELL